MFKKTSITTQFIIIFLFIALVPLALVSYLGFNNSQQALQQELTRNLSVLADYKASQIETYIRERLNDATVLANVPEVTLALEKLSPAYIQGVGSKEYLAVDSQFRQFLKYYQESLEYYDLFLINPQGEIIFTVVHESDFATNLNTGLYKDTELANVFRKSQTLLETSISDFRAYQPSFGKPAAFIAAPVFKDGSLIGSVALQMNNDRIYTVIQDLTGLGVSGETVIGKRMASHAGMATEDGHYTENEGAHVLFLNPLRHDPQAAFNKEVFIGDANALPIQNATQGIKGSGLSVDYRGQPVLAAWRYLPSFDWGMVVKIDANEAFASVAKLKSSSLAIGLVISIITIGLALFLSNIIAQPIKKLTQAAESISKGQLNAKLPSNLSNQEISNLTTSFERLIASLKILIAETKS